MQFLLFTGRLVKQTKNSRWGTFSNLKKYFLYSYQSDLDNLRSDWKESSFLGNKFVNTSYERFTSFIFRCLVNMVVTSFCKLNVNLVSTYKVKRILMRKE